MENHIELKKDKGLLKAILQSALVFTYLSDYRIGNKIIDFNKIFSTEYKTGAYIIYSYIKLKSMLLKFENLNCNCNYSKLSFKEGLELVKLLDVYEYFIILPLTISLEFVSVILTGIDIDKFTGIFPIKLAIFLFIKFPKFKPILLFILLFI